MLSGTTTAAYGQTSGSAAGAAARSDTMELSTADRLAGPSPA